MRCSHWKLLVVSLIDFFVLEIDLGQPEGLVLFIRDAVDDISVFFTDVNVIFVIFALD